MSTPEPYPYRKLNYPINNLEQSFTQEQKLQTRSNIGIPSSVDEEGKVLMVDNASGELVWTEAPNGLPDIASGDEGKFLSVENGEPAWTDVDIPEQVNADWEATSGVQEILNKPQMKPLVAGNNITITEGTSQFTISSTSDPQVNADWDATSGVQEILHKPNLSTVATTGQYADLLGKPDIPASTSELVNDSDFITASEAPVQDVKVDGSSVVDSNGVANISIPQFQQLNSDWDATSGVQEILNRPEVKPLVAGANITITETPSSVEIAGVSSVQLNADWDATSGVQEILNKPDLSIYAEKSDLATVATTGSYDDLADKPTIPSAQVNADWDATSGVSEILNRPNLATVATTGDYSDLQNLPSIPAAQVNSDWSATSGISEILNKPTVKQVVAGSNITITETADTFEIAMDTPIPSSTSDLTNDSGFITLSDLPPEEVAVMTYGTSTIEEYRAAVQSGKKIIVCKISDPDDGWRYVMQSQSSPFPEWSYDIGVVHCQLRLDHNGVTGWTTLTTNATTSADAGKVFTVDQYGRQVWATAQGTTYSAGTGIDITNNEISVDYDTNTLDTVYPTLTVNMATAGRYGTLILPTEIQTMAAGSSPSTVTIHIPANTLYLMGDYTTNPLRITMGDSEFWPSEIEGDLAQFTSVAVSCTYDSINNHTWIDEQDITVVLPCNSLNGWSNGIAAVYFTITVDTNYGNYWNALLAIESHSTLANPVVFSYPNTSAAQKLAVKNPLPESTSAEAGKYLKVDSNGDPTWATGGGGGGGVNADWDETDPLEPSYIENKPAPKTLTAGRGISIADGVSTVTISSTNQYSPGTGLTLNNNTFAVDTAVIQPKLTAGTNIAIDANNEISATDTTYTAGAGIAISNSNVISQGSPTTYAAADLIASKVNASVSVAINAVAIGPYITISGTFDPMAVVTITANTDVLIWTLKSQFAPLINCYTTMYPGNGSISYGGLRFAPDGKVYVHQNGTGNGQSRYFSITYLRAV